MTDDCDDLDLNVLWKMRAGESDWEHMDAEMIRSSRETVKVVNKNLYQLRNGETIRGVNVKSQ